MAHNFVLLQKLKNKRTNEQQVAQMQNASTENN